MVGRQEVGFRDRFMRAIGRRNSVYLSFVLVGGIIGEYYGNKFFDAWWISHNRGKLFEDIPGLGSRAAEE